MIFSAIIIFILLFIIVGLAYQFLFDIYLYILFLSMGFYALYLGILIYKRKKKPKKEVSIEPEGEKKEEISKEGTTEKEIAKRNDPELARLKEFVEKNLKKGYTKDMLQSALLKQGWKKEIIDKVLK